MRAVNRPATADAKPPELPFWTWALAATVFITLARMLAMRVSPLGLSPDEAQFWLWSRTLEPGYLSKPPLIAWIIRLATLGGDAESFVRLPSPLLHAATGLFLYGVGRRLYGGATGLFALLVYQLTPAVQIGAFVITTDTPLLAGLSAALLAYVSIQTASGRARLAAAAALGLALGLAFLAGYSALYAVAGVGLHLALSREARRAWRPAAALLAVAVFAVTISPNVIWNVQNGYASLGHLAGEAGWGRRPGGPLPALAFLAWQLAAFGPVLFLVLTGGAIWLGWRRRLKAEDKVLLAWTLPALASVLAQALIAGAQPDWAAAACAPGSVLVAAWMLRWRRPRVLGGLLAVHALVLALVLTGQDKPQLLDHIGLSAALKDLRGGRDLTQDIVSRAQIEIATGDQLSAVAIDDRALFNIAAYYGRDFFGREGPPLKAWRAGPIPRSEGELVSPLTPAFGARVLMVSRNGANTTAMQAQFRHADPVSISELWTGPAQSVSLDMFVGDGFSPAKR